MTHSFLPVIVGTDINAYNMAVSFHEEYGIRPVLVGKQAMSFTSLSSIVGALHIAPDLWDAESFVRILEEVAAAHRRDGQALLLIGTNDFYVRLIIENADRLRAFYSFNYISEALMNQLLVKSNFYALCEEHGLDYPQTHAYDCAAGGPFQGAVTFPVIVKPSNGVAYYKHKFEGQQKVYRVEAAGELQAVLDKITASGYREQLIVQDYIPGDDSFMWDSVVYVSSKKKTQLVTLAQVVLQEQTVTAIGNYTALITRYDEELMKRLQSFLEAIGYQGFANFDLKYDARDGRFKVFEVNIRQGRSSFYATSCGHNMARYFVDDLIHHQDKPTVYLQAEHLFTVVPKIVLRKFVKNPAIAGEVRRLLRDGRYRNPLFYKGDASVKRKFYLAARQLNYYRKYRKNDWQ